jgi:hypothetical protein
MIRWNVSTHLPEAVWSSGTLLPTYRRLHDPPEFYYPPTGGCMIRWNISILLLEAVNLKKCWNPPIGGRMTHQNVGNHLPEAACPIEMLIPIYQTDWLTDWLTDRLTVWLVGWLADWLTTSSHDSEEYEFSSPWKPQVLIHDLHPVIYFVT